jgi:hypothetical protein
MQRVLTLAAALAGGCNLVSSNGLHVGYSFDAQHFTENLGGDPQHPMTVPEIACAPNSSPDPCATQPMPGMPQLSCQNGACAATDTLALNQTIDLRNAQTPLPSEAVSFGINSVSIDRVAYFIASNTLDVDTPPIQLYVAQDTSDPNPVLLGTVAKISAGSSACNDPVDSKGDPMAMGQKVCDVPLTDAGQAELEQFIQKYQKMSFAILVRATLSAAGGSNVPAGALDFYVRPSVTLSILK